MPGARLNFWSRAAKMVEPGGRATAVIDRAVELRSERAYLWAARGITLLLGCGGTLLGLGTKHAGQTALIITLRNAGPECTVAHEMVWCLAVSPCASDALG
ncbi:MAG: hypothetical protein U1E05_25840 [Patescibacteria group bacterium]|nr:hypothetical protein [Patescibacteria group bacterium]